MERYHSNGKLLLTGEYVVLDGAIALALPTQKGQSLTVEESPEPGILWKSFDEHRELWYEDSFRVTAEGILGNSDDAISRRLSALLSEAHRMNPKPLSGGKGYQVSTHLDFDRNWGLGSSSTLVNNIAQWFGIDSYALLKNSFGGSGYDLAAAQHDQPILYSLEEGRPRVLTTSFDPAFKDQLFFVYLNRKQNSRHSIEHYRSQSREQLSQTISVIDGLTHRLLECQTLLEFELLLEAHEIHISQLINTPRVKTSLFPDYPRSLKSLGGWGGDFILATGGEEEKAYFREKGYGTVIGYSEMILY